MIGDRLGKSLEEIDALPAVEFYYWHEYILVDAENKEKAAKAARK